MIAEILSLVDNEQFDNALALIDTGLEKRLEGVRRVLK